MILHWQLILRCLPGEKNASSRKYWVNWGRARFAEAGLR